jgi:hypothetical protein
MGNQSIHTRPSSVCVHVKMRMTCVLQVAYEEVHLLSEIWRGKRALFPGSPTYMTYPETIPNAVHLFPSYKDNEPVECPLSVEARASLVFYSHHPYFPPHRIPHLSPR